MSNLKITPLARKLRRNQTESEKLLWYRIRNRQIEQVKFRRQYQMGRYIVDFISLEAKLIIELDGGQHNQIKNKTYDIARTKWFEQNGYRILRFWDNDVLGNINGVLEAIQTIIQLPHPNPLPKERD